MEGEDSQCSKMPASLLQEILVKKGMMPQFDVIANGTGSGSTSFTMQVSVGDRKALGNGRTKKDAKHDASKKMLDLLKKEEEFAYILRLKTEKKLVIDQNMNAVGSLYEYCKSNNIQPPLFKFEREEGTLNEKVFVYNCHAGNLDSEGKGSSMKKAKQKAAFTMLTRLKEEYVSDKTETNLNDRSKENKKTPKVRNSEKRSLSSESDESSKKAKLETPRDEDAIFGEYVAAKLRSADPEQKAQLKIAITKLMESGVEKAEEVKQSITIVSQPSPDQFAEATELVIQRLKENNIVRKYCKKAHRVPFADYHTLLSKEPFLNKSPTLTHLKEQSCDNIKSLDGLHELFEAILKEYQFEHSYRVLPSNTKSDLIVIGISVKSNPPWAFVATGPSEEEAKRKTILKALEFFHTMS